MGEYKKALVTWKDTTFCKEEGGMDFKDFYGLSLILKMRWCGHLFTNDSTIWVLLARESIARSLNMLFRRKTRRLWIAKEAWLLDEKLLVTGSPFIRDLCRDFNKACKALRFEAEGAAIPSPLMIEKLLLFKEICPSHLSRCIASREF